MTLLGPVLYVPASASGSEGGRTAEHVLGVVGLSHTEQSTLCVTDEGGDTGGQCAQSSVASSLVRG